MPHDTAVPSEASPVKVTTVPSEVSKKAVKKGGSTSAIHIAVLVTVAVACAVELLQYGMSIDEQEKVQKLEVKVCRTYRFKSFCSEMFDACWNVYLKPMYRTIGTKICEADSTSLVYPVNARSRLG
ncbi:unnamed protein product [Cylicostephanus goldi]|uniref:Uncharacterized protein n=1 Tax=Cylicostephanus goldi TaxID=71465 RepID=A0A3P7MQD8_CYLGO|nr:unnamed protein product [Cylicostephanus goldi]